MFKTITGSILVIIGFWLLYVTYRGDVRAKNSPSPKTAAIPYYFIGALGLFLLAIALELLTNRA